MGSSVENFILLQTLESVEAGQVLERIPPHVTVLSWFALRRSLLDEFIPVLDEVITRNKEAARHAVGTKRALFGVHKDIPVCKVDTGVAPIHDAALEWVDAHGGVFLYPKFARRLRTHVTDEAGISVQPGDKLDFSMAALVSKHDVTKAKTVEFSANLRSDE